LRTQTTAWLSGLGTGGTATNAQIAAAIKMSADQYNGLQGIAAAGTYAAVNNARSRGHEVEINYNATRYLDDQQLGHANRVDQHRRERRVDQYIAARMPIWMTLEDPRFTQTAQTIGGVTTPYATGPVTLPVGATGHLLWWYIKGTPFSTVSGYNATQSAADNFAVNVDAPMAVFRALIGRPGPRSASTRRSSTRVTTSPDLRRTISSKT
jgi:hypothetical protein